MRISAIIPLYNGVRFIAQAVTGVFAQTRLPDELIVVDDGSTDGGEGAQIIASLPISKLVPIPTTILHKPNGGQSSARNFGIAHSSADLIALLDQDDIWHPEHLAKLVVPFEKFDADKLGWVYSNFDLIDEAGAVIRPNALNRTTVEHPKRTLLACLSDNMHIRPSSALISRVALVDVRGFDERLIGYEDDDLFVRLFAAGYGNIYLPESLLQWRTYPSQTSRSSHMERSRTIFARKMAEAFPAENKIIVSRFMHTAIAGARNPIAARDNIWIAQIGAELRALARHAHGLRKPLLHVASIFFGDWRLACVFRKVWRIANHIARPFRRASPPRPSLQSP